MPLCSSSGEGVVWAGGLGEPAGVEATPYASAVRRVARMSATAAGPCRTLATPSVQAGPTLPHGLRRWEPDEDDPVPPD